MHHAFASHTVVSDRGRRFRGSGSRAAGLAVVLALLGTRSVAAPATAGPDAPSIDRITVETHCMGCADESTLSLSRSGEAVLTVPGQARMGTVARVSHGTILKRDFDELVRLAFQGQFMAMAPNYEDPELRDGAVVAIGLHWGAEARQVASREGAAPAGWQALRLGIAAWQARTVFRPSAP